MPSQLLRLYKQLSTTDRRALADLAACNYFNRRPEVTRLCFYLNEHAGRSPALNLSDEALFAAAFPDENYHNPRLRHTMSYLLDLLRRYLALQQTENDASRHQLDLLRAQRTRGLDAWFDRTWQQARTQWQNHPQRDALWHFAGYQLQQEFLEQASRNERSSGLNLQPSADQLSVFYTAEMLRHACLAELHQAVAGQAYQLALLEATLLVVEKEKLLEQPAVAVYYHAYHMLRQPNDDEAFTKLKINLHENIRFFSTEEQRGLFLLAINGCIRRMNAGRRAYVREAFDLYRDALETNVLPENGYLSGFNYKNIIRLGTALGELAWTENFLHTGRNILHPAERDMLFTYNLAYWYFQQQDYNRALPLLQQVDFEDPLNNLDVRRMLLRSYVELEEWTALDSLLQSFGAYLRRQKNLGYHRKNNEKLLVFVKKMLESDRKGRAALRAEVDATQDVAERAWLLEILRTR